MLTSVPSSDRSSTCPSFSAGVSASSARSRGVWASRAVAAGGAAEMVAGCTEAFTPSLPGTTGVAEGMVESEDVLRQVGGRWVLQDS